MPALILKFPASNDGEDHGLNDPGIETFEGEYGHHMARECAQNALDAIGTNETTVKLSFDLISYATDKLPCAKDLKEVFSLCVEYWNSNEKTKHFFKQAKNNISKEYINILKISDQGTTGLTGNDIDRDGKWYCLIRSGGVSNKALATGGSYGIGKFAPFAASIFRTVLYSTLTIEGSYAFQGVSRLVTHKKRSEVCQGTGYIGHYDKKFLAVRNIDQIPKDFRRSVPGTDLYVLGYRDEAKWDKNLIYTLLEDFWPAIINNKIEFNVGDNKINTTSIHSYMELMSKENDFTANLFLNCYLDKNNHKYFTAEIDQLGKIELYLLIGESYTKEIALTRKTGMVIRRKKFMSRIPFVGYFVCNDDLGNETLRNLEPPRHDNWEDKDRGSRENRRALKEALNWMKKCVNELNPTITSNSQEIPGLEKYLPDDITDKSNKAESEENNKEQDTSLISKVKESALPTVEHIHKEENHLNLNNNGIFSDSEFGKGKGQDTGTIVEGGKSKRKGGKLGEVEDHIIDDINNLISTDNNKTKARISDSRNFNLRSIRDPNGYKLIIRSKSNYDGSLKVIAIGEDGSEQIVRIKNAKDIDTGKTIKIINESVLENIKIKKDGIKSIRIELIDKTLLAFKITSK